jgi:hypothetical protein
MKNRLLIPAPRAAFICIASLVLLSSLMTSCRLGRAPAAVQGPSPTPAESETLIPTLPTRTAVPTRTATVPAFTATPTRNPADELLMQLLPGCTSREYSPTSVWSAGWNCTLGGASVVSVDKSLRWDLTPNDYYPFTGARYGSLIPAFWTANNRYLYLTIDNQFIEPIGHFYSGLGLLRLDLPSGFISIILKPGENIDYSYSFSPDGSRFGYIVNGVKPLAAYFVDQKSGVIQSVKISEPNNEAGNFLWSPDWQQVVYEEAVIDLDDPTGRSNLFSLALFNASDGSRKILLTDQRTELIPTRWKEKDRVELADAEGACWVYELPAKGLSEIPCVEK